MVVEVGVAVEMVVMVVEVVRLACTVPAGGVESRLDHPYLKYSTVAPRSYLTITHAVGVPQPGVPQPGVPQPFQL